MLYGQTEIKIPHFTLWDALWAEMRAGTSSVFRTCELRHLISGKRYSRILNLQASLHSICNFSINEFAMIRQFQFARRKKNGLQFLGSYCIMLVTFTTVKSPASGCRAVRGLSRLDVPTRKTYNER